MKYKTNDLVVIKKTGKRGSISQILCNPYLPNWLSKPNYLVYVSGEFMPKVFKENELTKIEER